MKTYLQAYFDKLKMLVLNQSQITQIVPADCYRLALEIKAATNKSISETTLKRVFGFASSIHQPSIYTLNALAEYCGFDGWDYFYTCMEQNKLQASQQKSWSEVAAHATKISLFNIQSNKYKCGIPYHMTINRERMYTFIDRFHRSDATIGILSGAPGNGKTIAVSRWVENQISQGHAAENQDIYLFTNSLSLLQSSAFGYHSNRWLAHMLGLDTGELLDQFIEEHRDSAPGNFYLIVDELQSDLVADRQFHAVITQFIDMARHFAQYRWFRIILVLRTSTLFKHESLFKDTVINPQWFSVLSGPSGNEWANMPAFSNTELQELLLLTDGNAKPLNPLSVNKHALIRTPLFFQYHYELNGETLDLDNISHFDEYLIITRFLKKKVFNGINTLHKQALMEELAALVDEHGDILQINKKQAYIAIKQYRTAYNDLLHTGVLHEVNSGCEIRQQITIQFQSAEIAAYFMALNLFNGQHDPERLIGILDQSDWSRKTKTDQLKWLLLFYIEAGDLRFIDRIGSIPFIKDNQFEVIAFICDGLDKIGKTAGPDIRNALDRGLHNSPFVDYMLRYTCLQAEYEPNVMKLLSFTLSEPHEIALRSKLAVIALLKWDEDALVHQLEKLSTIPKEAYANFAINPFKALSDLYQYFKGGTMEQFIQELHRLPLRVPQTAFMGAAQLFDLVVYLWVKVSDNTDVAYRYRDFIYQKLGKINPANTFELDFTTLIYAFYLLECGDREAAIAYVAQGSPSSLNHITYRLLHIIFHIQSGKLQGNDDYKILGQRAISICEAYGFKLLETYCRILILEDIPKDEQLLYINNLKFQYAAFGYTMGLAVLSKKYG
ncbi:hypothetical protein SAMN05421747_1283 [Parapedobacter composti]|uniref:Uncharacterized protein n=1 Tax=Parapedobacter composti TaxID=623281 RepID=A0A1I1M8U7_9SPHI|nr:hypothetical protein [Parapedobacter composti]SFC79638.1 hypothetical protein SAMN05421747_1283 [Parapedobacter composti]